jgi:hypothetical protein
LPAKRFEVPVWQFPTVHPDQFFSFKKKRFSLPKKYCGAKVAVKKLRQMLYVFFDYQLIRTYIITKQTIYYQKEDFPEVVNEMMDGGYPKFLLKTSRKYGQAAYELTQQILRPHAFLNARRAQGFIEVYKKFAQTPGFESICRKAMHKGIVRPKSLKILFEEQLRQSKSEQLLLFSQTGQEMIREIEYFIN